MRRMTLSQRIGAVGCLVLLTVAIALFYSITKGFSKDIAFATLELHGNRYQRPLEDLLENICEHQLLARRYLTGHKNLQGSLAAVEGRGHSFHHPLSKGRVGAAIEPESRNCGGIEANGRRFTGAGQGRLRSGRFPGRDVRVE